MQRNISDQSGRSMIEMLGVLSIVGVLSVAGITGYSKAMFKYRMNQTVDTVAQIFRNLEEVTTKPFGTTEYSTSNPQDLIDLGIYPECKITTSGYWSDNGGCKLPLGQLEISYTFSSSEGYPKGRGVFVMTFTGTNKKNECISFLSYHWDNAIPPDMYIPRGHIGLGGKEWPHIMDPNTKASYSESDIVSACNKACVDDLSYCFVKFAIHGDP